jgi:DNA polymerase III delta prime subunit
MSEKKILLAGLPSTGKTTFIAALWYYVNCSNTDKSLTLNSLAKGEQEYLNKIRQAWLSYEQVQRNIIANFKGEEVIMNLKKTENGENIVLNIPDFSGEAFKAHFDSREWTKEYDAIINDLTGLVLFINPSDEKNRSVLISKVNETARLLGDKIPETNEGVILKNWDPEHTSNQVKLVESLQFIQFHKLQNRTLKVSVVISLWDEVIKNHGNNSFTPEKWLEKHMPLLYQFIICNKFNFLAEYFGISAQGLDYVDDEKVEEFTNSDPIKRILVKQNDIISNDIARPITWITG